MKRGMALLVFRDGAYGIGGVDKVLCCIDMEYP
jgi:hypothetical protein